MYCVSNSSIVEIFMKSSLNLQLKDGVADFEVKSMSKISPGPAALGFQDHKSKNGLHIPVYWLLGDVKGV